MTLVIQVPSPMNGYVNLGDCGVLLSAWILGPWYGGAAAGIGSMLADIFSGYAHYAPGTLAIKLSMAVLAGLAHQKLPHKPTAKLFFISSLRFLLPSAPVNPPEAPGGSDSGPGPAF